MLVEHRGIRHRPGVTSPRIRALAVGCAVASLALVGVASAQEPSVDDQGEAGASAEPVPKTLDGIVVTAQRRVQRLEEVPQSVVALSAEALDRANVVNLHDLGRVAPGVQVNFGGLSTQPSIRGVSSLTNGTGNENNIAVYVDGFYVPDNTSINMDLANLESIEVLKGPQGTLYGRNATGGAILINTMSPTDFLTARSELSYGRFDDSRFSGYVSGPLGDRARAMAAVSYRNSDGNIDLTDPADVWRRADPAASIEQRSLRTKLEIDVTDNLRATLAYNYAFSSDASGVLFTTFDYIPAYLPGGNFRANRVGTASYNYDATASTKTNEGTLKLEWTTPIGVLRSYTGYAERDHEVDYDFDGTYVDITYGTSPANQKTTQQAFDLVIDSLERVDLVVGALYLRDEIRQPGDRGQRIYNPGLITSRRTFRPMETEAFAVYADANIALTERLDLGVGGRYSYDKRWVSQLIDDAAGNVLVPYFEDEATFSRFTPRATLRYEVAPRSNVYASWSKGFRSGSFNSAQVASAELNLPIKPEDITAFEVGFKTFRQKHRFEAAAFYYDYKNLNVSLTVPNPACGESCSPITVVGNAPEAEVYGVDGQWVFSPTERLNVTLGASWLHARYGRFPNAIGVGVNATSTGNITGQVQDWTGQRMARAPDLSAQLGVDYTVRLWGGSLRLSGNVAYSSEYAISNPSLYGPLAPTELRDRQRYLQDDTTLVSADIAWTDPDDRYWVGLYGKNLANESYRQTYNGGAFGDYSAEAPRASYGIRFGVRF